MSWVNIIFILYQIIAIMAVIHVVMDNRQPAKTMAWALVIWFIPVVGIVLYLFFGINTRKERHVSERSMNQLTKRSMLEFVEQKDLRLPEKHKPLIDQEYDIHPIHPTLRYHYPIVWRGHRAVAGYPCNPPTEP
jgi:cardiolipin synthase